MAKGKNYMQDAGFKKRLAEEEFILEVTEVICKIMTEENISRKQLADKLGKTKGSISQLLNGERNLTLRTVADILHVLGYRGLLEYEKVLKKKESKSNVFRLHPPQVSHEIKKVMKWKNPDKMLCPDNYTYSTALGV